MFEVFISHSSKDKLTADAVCAILEQRGIRCWIAPRDITPGVEWGEAILTGIEACSIMVLVFSANANASPQVRREVERAVNKGLIVVPLRIEDILPAKAMEYFLSNVHWLDAFTPPMTAHVERLAGKVLGMLGRVAAGSEKTAAVRNTIQLPILATATKDVPWTNSLGMKFVPSGTPGVLMSIWQTRVQDYEVFVRDSERAWRKPEFAQEPTHPAVYATWEDAVAFCEWLSKKEGRSYRLPTDAEWSTAVGLTGETGATPKEKGEKASDYPWGADFPPPMNFGNYGVELNVDSFEFTSPVGSFKANRLGIHDLSGNVWEWCDDKHDSYYDWRTLRGGSWGIRHPEQMRSSYRCSGAPAHRYVNYGFRCALSVAGSGR